MLAANYNKKRRRNELFGPWVNTREWALEIGSRFYFDGEVCSNGHVSKRGSKDGRCCECGKQRSRTNYWENPEEKRAKARDDHFKNRDRNLERAKEYGEQHADEIKVRRLKYNAANRERRTEMSREWHENNKERATEYRKERAEIYAAHARNRRARINSNGGEHTAEDVADILRIQKYKCAECGTSVRKRGNRHVDHIMPIALGGSNDKTNLQILCPTCNLSKSDLHPVEFARRKGRLL